MSKRSPHSQLPRPEFAMTGVVLGACAGMAIGLIVEIVRKRGVIVMQAGGFAGISIGALVESIRFGWRNYRYRKLRREVNEPAPPASKFAPTMATSRPSRK